MNHIKLFENWGDKGRDIDTNVNFFDDKSTFLYNKLPETAKQELLYWYIKNPSQTSIRLYPDPYVEGVYMLFLKLHDDRRQWDKGEGLLWTHGDWEEVTIDGDESTASEDNLGKNIFL
jgi:hypothetical protein